MDGVVDNVGRLLLPQLGGLDMHNDDVAFRLRVREMLRARQAGAVFCDDGHHNNPMEPPTLPSHVLTGIRNSNLVASADCASTEDHPDQRAGMTVQNDNNFWSSTGSPHEIGEEFILYKLRHPLSVVRAVVVQVYRATFQGGGPIYPAKQILVDVGHSPSTMRTVGGPFMMACTDAEQTFMIPPSHQAAATGSYVGIRFLGKHQKQLFDDLYYLSIRHIRVLGTPCAAADITALRSLTSIPNPSRAILPPACIPQPLIASLDKLTGSNHAASKAVEHPDEYIVKIELPGWAQKDFMHFVEQLASSARTQAPSHQLPSLHLQFGSAARGSHACTTDWPSDLKANSNLPLSMLAMPHDVLAGANVPLHGNMHGGGMHMIRDDPQYIVLDDSDTTAVGDVAPEPVDAVATLYARAQEDPPAGPASGSGELHPPMDHDNMQEGTAAGPSSMDAERPVETAGDISVHFVREHSMRGQAVGGRQDSTADEAWLQGTQEIRGMAELDAAAAVPGLMFGASSPVLSPVQPSAYGTLPPITLLGNTRTWAAGREWVPPWPCMHAHEACDGPVHASVCQDGGLRCVVWERRGRQALEQRCEAVEESEMQPAGDSGCCGSPAVDRSQGQAGSSGASTSAQADAHTAPTLHQSSLKTAPAALMWCRDPSSSAVGGVRLQGVRKRPPGGPARCDADLHNSPPLRAPGSLCSRGDIQRMLFGPVQAERFTVPMD